MKIFVKIYRFFVPKEGYKAAFYNGVTKANMMKAEGKVSIKWIPTWWIGKGLRRMIDPFNKMKFKNKGLLK